VSGWFVLFCFYVSARCVSAANRERAARAVLSSIVVRPLGRNIQLQQDTHTPYLIRYSKIDNTLFDTLVTVDLCAGVYIIRYRKTFTHSSQRLLRKVVRVTRDDHK
jgi:hypothetical protein